MGILDVARPAALAGAVVLASMGAAAAQEGVFMKDLLGSVGIIPKERPKIDYRERAPLVLPPKMELRDPADPKAAQALSPQWPNDPDVVAARRREAEARIPVTETERRRLERNATLPIDEIRRGRRPGAEVPTEPEYRPGDRTRDSVWVNPTVLRAQGRTDDTKLSDVEPERSSLTEPPTGFRKPTMKVKPGFEVEHKTDEANPQAYWREQRARQ